MLYIMHMYKLYSNYSIYYKITERLCCLYHAEDDAFDTNVLLSALQPSLNVQSMFQEIQGRYSFIYFQKSTNLLYFDRDIVGRHSLLLKVNTGENTLTLTFVASKKINKIIEIPAIGIFITNLDNSRVNLACYPWKEPDLHFTDIIEIIRNTFRCGY